MAGDMGMFGAPIGQSNAEQDMAKLALASANIQHMQAQDQLVPFRAAQMAGQSRYLNARGAGLEQTALTQQRIAQMAANADWSPDDLANPAWKLADFALKSGDAETAVKYATKASTIDQHVASADLSVSRNNFVQARTAIINYDNLSRDLRTVTSPEELRTVLQRSPVPATKRLLDAQGNLLPQVAENWDSYAKDLSELAVNEKDRTAAKARADALASAERERSSKQKNRTFWQDFSNQERRAAAQARGRGTKAGVNIFDKTEGYKIGADYVRSQFSGLEVPQANMYGRELADRARILRDKNPALTPREAVMEVFKEMDRSGKFQGLNRRPGNASPENAIPLPDSPDQSKLKTGQYYKDDKGNSREWLGPGKGWGPAQRIGKIKSANAELDDTAADAADAQQNAEDDALAMEEDTE